MDAQPNLIAEWVVEPPPRTKAADVVGHIFARWASLQSSTPTVDAERQRAEEEAERQRIEEMPAEQRQANLARLRAEMVKSGLMSEKQANQYDGKEQP